MSNRLNDQRLFDRFDVNFPVKFRNADADYDTNVFLSDASARGLRVKTNHQLFLNDSVSLMIKVPDSDTPFMVNGSVRWISAVSPDLWEAGICFYKIDLLRMNRLYKYFASEQAV